MALLVRDIRASRWYWGNGTDVPDGMLPAISLIDLNAADNTLSFWATTEDLDELNDLVVARAADKQVMNKLDFAVVDESAVSELGIKVEATLGKTPHAKVQGLHRNLVFLTAQDVVRLAEAIQKRDQIIEISKPDVRTLLAKAVKAGEVDPEDLTSEVREHLENRRLI